MSRADEFDFVCAFENLEVILHLSQYFTDWQDYAFMRSNAM